MTRFLAVALLMVAAGLSHAEVRDPYKHFFDPKLGDFKSDLAAAKQDGKKGVLLMFEMDECPFCHRMKETVLNQSEVQDYFRKHFAIYSVDVKGDTSMVDFKGKDTTEKAFAIEHRVRATPVFAFFDLDGNLVYRFTGAAKDINEFMLLGRYVAEGAYKTQTFTVYKQGAK